MSHKSLCQPLGLLRPQAFEPLEQEDSDSVTPYIAPGKPQSLYTARKQKSRGLNVILNYVLYSSCTSSSNIMLYGSAKAHDQFPAEGGVPGARASLCGRGGWRHPPPIPMVLG